MACKLEEAVQEINKLLALPTVNKEKMMVDKLNLAKQSIEAQMKVLGAKKTSDTGTYKKSSMIGEITVYHGTNVPIKSFDKSKAGGARDSKLGHFFTDSLETAIYYGVLKKYPELATNDVAQDEIIEEVMKDPFNYQKHGIYIVTANISLDNAAEANRDGKQKDFTAEAAKEKENALSKYDVLIDRNVIDGNGLSNTYLVRDVDNIQIVNSSKVNISSGTKGLPGALTNHTVLSKKKGSIESDYPIEFNGMKYDSVESAYQDNKVDESKTKPTKEDSQNYKLMVELISEKFASHPRLVSAVTKLGGLKYLENAVHQPTSKNTVWETGGQDWFMSAMKEAYNNAIAEPKEQIKEVKEETTNQPVVADIDPIYEAMSNVSYGLIGEGKYTKNGNTISRIAEKIVDKKVGNIIDYYGSNILVYDDRLDSDEPAGVTMLIRDESYQGKELGNNIKNSIETAHDNGGTFAVSNKEADKVFIQYLDELKAKYKIYDEGSIEENKVMENKSSELISKFFTKDTLSDVLSKMPDTKAVFNLIYSPYSKELNSDTISDADFDAYNTANQDIKNMFVKAGIDFNKYTSITKGKIIKAFADYGVSDENSKYEIFKGVYANEEQKAAIDVLSEFLKGNENSILLKGRGGVGKTSIIAKVLDNSGVSAKNIHYITPTNKATKILKLMSEKANGITDSQFLTVAQALSYEMKNGKLVRKLDKYGNPVPPKVLGNKFTPKAKVIVVDESSMLDKGMFDILQEIVKQNKDMKIIYMGDNVQLPPVNENSHVSSVFKNHTNSSRVELTKRMRQKAESPILPITDVLAKAVETRVNLDGSPVTDTSKHSEIKFATPTNSEVRYVTRENSMKEFIDTLKAEPESTRWIMFNNNEHAEGIKVTEMVRRELFGAEAAKKEYIKGEQLYITSPYQDGAVLNTGDELTVQKILKENEITPITFEYWDTKIKRYATTTVKLPVTTLIVKENLLQEVLEVNAMTKESMKVIRTLPENQQYGIKQALLQNSPAYVLTSHKAQGSTYKNVYADIGNIFKNPKSIRVDNIQSAYVATSRASESLVMVDVPVQYRESIKPKIGSVVTYKSEYYIVKKVNEKANNVQLINKNGDSLPGTPGIDKVQFVKQLPVTEFNGVEYAYDEKNDRLYTENGEKWKNKSDPTRAKIISSIKQEVGKMTTNKINEIALKCAK